MGASVEVSRVRVNRMYFIGLCIFGRSEQSTTLFKGLAVLVYEKIEKEKRARKSEVWE